MERTVESTTISLFNWMKYNGERRRSEWTWVLTFEQMKSLVFQNCFYCGIEPNSKYPSGKSKLYIKYNGLDRVKPIQLRLSVGS